MRQREYAALVRRASVAYQLKGPDYERIMDNAATTVADWEKFITAVEVDCHNPPTDRERARYRRQYRENEIAEIKRMQQMLNQRISALVMRST